MSYKPDHPELKQMIRARADELGFSACRITDTDLGQHETWLENWLKNGCHGEMHYMTEHGKKRSRPEELLPGTLRVISVRMDYLPQTASQAIETLRDTQKAYISRYALGRDYHKMMRKRLQKLSHFVAEKATRHNARVFVDSAPVLEKALAEKAGVGWIGKHSNLLTRDAGSWFFLGEIFTDLPLTIDEPLQQGHCGDCSACIQACPTDAIIAPYRIDARRCISYLTIEHKSAIPVSIRKQMGNRIYGCDDCQLFCPWTRFTPLTREHDFLPRHQLDNQTLQHLFSWSEEEFLAKTEGSAIRRIGHIRWLRNISVALGNGPFSQVSLDCLQSRLDHPSALLKEHVVWAIGELERKRASC